MPNSTKRTMFSHLNARVFDDPEFKEDSVREEVIAPILRRLGYSASGSHRVVRSRALIDPFVKIGSQTKRIEIVPDYLLLIDDQPAVVLDAKAPTEKILKSRHVEQVYSYAIHPWTFGRHSTHFATAGSSSYGTVNNSNPSSMSLSPKLRTVATVLRFSSVLEPR